MSIRLAGRALDQFEGALDGRQVAETEEVHLEQSEVLDPVHLVLGDDLRILALALHRHDLLERHR